MKFTMRTYSFFSNWSLFSSTELLGHATKCQNFCVNSWSFRASSIHYEASWGSTWTYSRSSRRDSTFASPATGKIHSLVPCSRHLSGQKLKVVAVFQQNFKIFKITLRQDLQLPSYYWIGHNIRQDLQQGGYELTQKISTPAKFN